MERHEIFTQIYISLKKEGRVRNKGDFAKQIGISGDTVTRIINYGSKVSDDTFLKIEDKFPDMVDWALITGVQPTPKEQTPAPAPPPTQDKPEQNASIIDLYAHLIKEVESIRRDLEEERQRTRELNAQLQLTLERLSHLLPYSNPDEGSHLRVAEEIKP